jgi:galactose mutarotase-like enzyme
MEFAVVKWNVSETAFSLKSGLKTYEAYPFEFDFQVGFRLDGNTLHQSFKVVNQDDEAMPLSLGAHPAFNVAEIDSASIEFEELEDVSSDTVSDGIRTGEMRDVIEGNRLQLSQTVFDRDALIFSLLKSSKLLLKDGDKPRVEVEAKGFPYLGIWSKPGANYVCIEPWYGIADKQGHDQNIWTKEGILRLEPEQSFECSFAMRFFD